MKARRLVVLDPNTLISGVLLNDSVPGQAVRKAIAEDVLQMSEDSLYELADVLSRKQFDRCLSVEDREEFVRLVPRVVVMICAPHSSCTNGGASPVDILRSGPL